MSQFIVQKEVRSLDQDEAKTRTNADVTGSRGSLIVVQKAKDDDPKVRGW